MAQPPAYNRLKDFTENFGDETDHSALNAELDKAANSINDIRANLAILQADDGKLRPAVVTAESIDSAVYDGIIAKMAGQDISQAVLTKAEDYADISTQQADIATEQAVLAKNAKDAVIAFYDDIFPVGSIFQSFVNKPPKIGTWTLLTQGVVLLSAGSSYSAGTTYGSDKHTLTTAEMPSHTHATTIASAGGHTHTRGSMEIEGKTAWNTSDDQTTYPVTGAFYQGESKKNLSWGGSGTHKELAFKASRSWTGSTSSNGAHSHTATVSATGNGTAFSLMQKSIAVYIFRRTA